MTYTPQTLSLNFPLIFVFEKNKKTMVFLVLEKYL